eukprot:4301036-Prymnesium_polylepis.1
MGRACDQVMALMAARADVRTSDSDATEALAGRDLRMAVPLWLQKSRFSMRSARKAAARPLSSLRHGDQIRRSPWLLAQCAYCRRRCKAGGRRQA